MIALVALTSLAALCLLVAERREHSTAIHVAKPLASTGYLAVALSAGALQTPHGKLLLLALLCCWAGDLLLLYRLTPGLAAFTAAHLAFAATWLVRGSDPLLALAATTVLALPAALAFEWLKPHIPPRLRLPVIGYVTLLVAAVALAAGTRAPLAAAGALCFYLSDLAVARNRFVAPGFANKLWGLPLYYGGVLLICGSLAS